MSVALIDLETGKKTPLTRKKSWSGKKDSRCFFMEGIHYKNYSIQLRLDPNDNPSVDPVLDANIYDQAGNEIEKGSWHHTEKEYNSETNSRIYTFKFEELQLLLKFAIGYHQALTEAVGLVDNFIVKVVRGNLQEKKDPPS
ncbi:MAG: hypothetical protein NWE93_14800 [Candidatus Bathyarchaeota archaeon]|nr:hypothetical protein [Candidatus Bathyarchaeota archaeon]